MNGRAEAAGGFWGHDPEVPLDLGALTSEAFESISERLADKSMPALADTLVKVGNCSHPIRLRGCADTFDSSSPNSSRVRTVISSRVAADFGSSTPTHGLSVRYPSRVAVVIAADSSPCTLAIVSGARPLSAIARTHPATCRYVSALTG